MKVIIVESPSKSKTIESYMGDEYKVIASNGHIRDLSTSGKGGLGIDIPSGFIPKYVVMKEKAAKVSELKKICKGNEIFLATDPDREGEAISWHLAEVLGLDVNTVARVEFNEITKNAILEAFHKPRRIDTNLVSSQETRRMLDRIIGFQLSGLLKRKIKSKSAGRVQSSVLKLVCDLEEEIQAFVSVPYYNIYAHFDQFKLEMVNEKGEKLRFEDRNVAEEAFRVLTNHFVVNSIVQKEQLQESKAPLITSTLQQLASNKHGFSPDRTMRVAQSLYEGKELGGTQEGLITYMRTDSTRLSEVFTNDAISFIRGKYGNQYVGKIKTKKGNAVQDAHEAIRPTDVRRTPESVKQYLSNDEYRIYKLIYDATLASLMSAAKFLNTTITFINETAYFKMTGKVLLFDGHLKLAGISEEDENKLIPEFVIGETYSTTNLELKESFTKPKARFSEATLIKEMEELGIGRPSTYAQTIKTLLERQYVEIKEKRIFPTEQGMLTTVKLQEYFSSIINTKYTSEMETVLDEIAKGQANNVIALQEFYDAFYPLYIDAMEHMEGLPEEKTGEDCPECGSPLVIRVGRYGNFTACSNYPECKYIKKEVKEVKEGILCPECRRGHIVERVASKGPNKGNTFYACSTFPKCKAVYDYPPTEQFCNICGSVLVETPTGLACSNKQCGVPKEVTEQVVHCPNCKTGHFVEKMAFRGRNKGNKFYACSNYPKCKTIFNFKPLPETCQVCGSIMLSNGEAKSCSNQQCDNFLKL